MSKKISFSLCLACLVVLFSLLGGCGGGGGGSSSPSGTGIFTVYTNFIPGSAGGPTGQSEVITLKTTAGVVVQTQTISKSPNSPSANFSGLPSATLLVHAALYSGTNGTGTITGTTDTSISGGTASFITTAIGQPITTAEITPGNVSVAEGVSAQLSFAAQDANNDFVFESGAPVWSSSSPTIAKVSSSGLVTGVAVGQASITGSLNGIQATASAVVTGISKGTWTIMVFLNAANDLDAESFVNEAQMQQIAQTATSPTRIIVQWKRSKNYDSGNSLFFGTRRYLEVAGGRQLIQDLGDAYPGVDMGSPATLKDFVNWGVQNFPAQHYALVMWDHGNGWSFKLKRPKTPVWRGISYDYDTKNHINVNEIPQAISPNHLDIISFDACLMQMLEDADGLYGVADYMVCAEDNTPAPGYPYNASFAQFFTNPNGSTPTLAEGIVDGFINNYNGDPTYGLTPLSQSVIDLSKIANISSAVNTLSNALLASSGVGSITPKIRSSLINYGAGDGYFYYDIGSLAKAFAASEAPSAVVQAATNLQAAEVAAVVYSRTDSGGNPVHSFSPNSTGLSIDFSNSSEFATYSTDYAQLLLAEQTHWGQFLASTTANP